MSQNQMLATFYNSGEWRAFRKTMIAKRGNICAHCNIAILDARAIIAHHKQELTPDNIHNPAIAFGEDNIDLICFDCHNKSHKRFGYAQYEDRHVYLVYGPPCAGKSCFVMQHMLRGDLMLDIDIIYSAVSGLSLYDKPQALRQNVFAIRDLLLDQIKTRTGKWGNAWIIGGYPEAYARQQLINELGAEPIFIEATREECLSQAIAGGNRPQEWQGYINNWFERYIPA